MISNSFAETIIQYKGYLEIIVYIESALNDKVYLNQKFPVWPNDKLRFHNKEEKEVKTISKKWIHEKQVSIQNPYYYQVSTKILHLCCAVIIYL